MFRINTWVMPHLCPNYVNICDVTSSWSRGRPLSSVSGPRGVEARPQASRGADGQTRDLSPRQEDEPSRTCAAPRA
ncbi:hypothetical protein RRG08_032110 [Elysia crispata]|uniref:Uncharacterized protein n=1 Tax=Elysia crispata TaxID=231223 RepID=A0AAE0ZDT5_9GAST|nr:hypothetical protein RRG08_032110 [Elysia crispata]